MSRTSFGGTVLAESQVTGLTADLAARLALAGGTMTGDVVLAGAPSTGLHPATKTYADELAANLVQPVDEGYIAWAYDPANVSAGNTITAGVIQLVKVYLRKQATIASVSVYVQTGGSSLTSSQNWAGLYNSSGTRLDVGPDQTTAWGTVGLKTATLGTPQVCAAGSYYVAFVSNGTTPPLFGRGGQLGTAILNGTLAASALRFATNGTGQTTLPSSLTLSSSVGATPAYWVGVS